MAFPSVASRRPPFYEPGSKRVDMFVKSRAERFQVVDGAVPGKDVRKQEVEN